MEEKEKVELENVIYFLVTKVNTLEDILFKTRELLFKGLMSKKDFKEIVQKDKEYKKELEKFYDKILKGEK